MDWKVLEQELIDIRRDFHRYPENAWTEFRTTSLIAERLDQYGYEPIVGLDNIELSAVMGRTSEKEIDAHIERAKTQGGNAAWIDKMQRYTGAVAVLKTGRPGPVVSLRFDIDCVDVDESKSPDHRPQKEGFVSQNSNLTHSCGHDAHTAIGLGVAKVLMEKKDSLNGEIRLIFQPGEEGCRGAYAMTEKGVVDGSDYFLALHIGSDVPSGVFVLNTLGYLATTKIDAEFIGLAAHAAGAPQKGKNALLAASAATLGLFSIAPHADGRTSLNVGVLNAGTGRNVIADHATLKAETRGETKEIADYIFARAEEVLKGAAAMYGTEVRISKAGEGTTAFSDAELIEKVRKAVDGLNIFREIWDVRQGGGSEDATWMMRRVQEGGGQAVYLGLGSDITAPHHNGRFDIDESTMLPGVKAFVAITECLSQE